MLKAFTKKLLSLLLSFVFVSMTASNRLILEDGSGGYMTAVNTIKANLGDESIEVAEDFSTYDRNQVQNWLITDEERSDDYIMWSLPNDDDDVAIIFLFRNDSKMVMAAKADKSFVTSDFMVDLSFKSAHNQKAYNHATGAFAWQYNNMARAILNSQAGYSCSSIWAKTSNQISLIWFDSSNPYWENYSNSENPSD